MNNETQPNKLSPVIDIRTKQTLYHKPDNIEQVESRYFLNSETQIVGHEGYSRKLGSTHETQLQVLSLKNKQDVIRTKITVINKHTIVNTTTPTYLLTISNGAVIQATSEEILLSATGEPIKVKDIETGDMVKSGSLKYDHGILYPSLNYQLNYVIDKQRILSLQTEIYEVELKGFNNILIGQELDGETSVLCVHMTKNNVA